MNDKFRGKNKKDYKYLQRLRDNAKKGGTKYTAISEYVKDDILKNEINIEINNANRNQINQLFESAKLDIIKNPLFKEQNERMQIFKNNLDTLLKRLSIEEFLKHYDIIMKKKIQDEKESEIEGKEESKREKEREEKNLKKSIQGVDVKTLLNTRLAIIYAHDYLSLILSEIYLLFSTDVLDKYMECDNNQNEEMNSKIYDFLQGKENNNLGHKYKEAIINSKLLKEILCHEDKKKEEYKTKIQDNVIVLDYSSCPTTTNTFKKNAILNSKIQKSRNEKINEPNNVINKTFDGNLSILDMTFNGQFSTIQKSRNYDQSIFQSNSNQKYLDETNPYEIQKLNNRTFQYDTESNYSIMNIKNTKFENKLESELTVIKETSNFTQEYKNEYLITNEEAKKRYKVKINEKQLIEKRENFVKVLENEFDYFKSHILDEKKEDKKESISNTHEHLEKFLSDNFSKFGNNDLDESENLILYENLLKEQEKLKNELEELEKLEKKKLEEEQNNKSYFSYLVPNYGIANRLKKGCNSVRSIFGMN